MRKRTGMFIFVVSLVLVHSISFAQQRDAQPVKFQQVSDRLYQVMGGSGAQGGAYIGDTGALLIDSKMDKESVDKVINEVKRITDKPILYLVNTHSDGDHVSGNKFFPKAVTFIAHENCRKEFFVTRNGAPSEWEKTELLPFIPSITFREKMDIYLGPRKVELWYFGVGHTTGDAVVYFPEAKTAFIGDQIFIGRPQLIHSYKAGNSFEHVRTLNKMLRTLDAEKFCSGHSEIADREAVKKHIAQMEELQDKIKTLIKQGKSINEIKSAFNENEARLIETIFAEINEGRM